MKKLANIEQNFADWYQDVISESGLIDSSPTRGCFVLMPYGYAIWENIKNILDAKIKEQGVQNIYLPMLIPESFLKKEEKHVEGFAPEVAVVTHAGGKKLEEAYVIRPTSETIVYHMFAKWIKSYRDLPLKINQWANIIRWEKRTRAFIRTVEILWQEGHTAHSSFEEAKDMAKTMLNIYKEIAEDYLAIPVITGEKTESERFAGADHTYTFEGLMQDGKALQMGTSHQLAQSFSSAFDVKYQDKDGQMRSPYCTSWGVTTRLIGAIIMTHGDQNGLILPPRIAPIQVVIIPIFRSEEQRTAISKIAQSIKKELESKDFRVVIDNDDQKTPGAKFFHWEVKGVPIRIEIGPKDTEKEQVVIVNRAEPDKAKKKQFVPIENILTTLETLLDTIQATLLEKATKRRDEQWYQVDTFEQLSSQLERKNGLYQTGWCGNSSCEEKLKTIKGTIRCIITQKRHVKCFACNKVSTSEVLIAKAY